MSSLVWSSRQLEPLPGDEAAEPFQFIGPLRDHRPERDPVPHPRSELRIAAAVARISRCAARAADRLPDVFGSGAVSAAFSARVSELRRADGIDGRASAAARLRELLTRFGAVCEEVEMTSETAAALSVDFAEMIAACELVTTIAGEDDTAAAA